MHPRVLAVGRTSVLAQAFAAHGGLKDVRFVRHTELACAEVFEGVDLIINFALDPAYRSGPYRADIDVDRRLGAEAARRGLRYVLLSSRKVYAPAAAFGASEDAPIGPSDAYGRNKWITEQALRELLGPALTVLRIGNVLGYERIPGRSSFANLMLARLKAEGRILLDVSPFVRRDFLPVEDVARALGRVVAHGLRGTFNLGSGVAVECGRIALWVLEGYGRGELLVTSPRHHDEFQLDVRRLAAAIGPITVPETLADYCRALGRRLAKEGTDHG